MLILKECDILLNGQGPVSIQQSSRSTPTPHPPINLNVRVVQQSLGAFLAGALIYLCKSPEHPQWTMNIFLAL